MPKPRPKKAPRKAKVVRQKRKKTKKVVRKARNVVRKSRKATRRTKKVAPKAKRNGRTKEHPKLVTLLAKLRPGRHAGGTLIFNSPGAHHAEMSEWLMGRVDGRVALGRTAFGDIVVFRDLRADADDLGIEDPANACDIALIDVHQKRMTVIAESVDELLEFVDDREWQNDYLRRDLYDAVKARIGDYGDDEVYAFVPALALGGSEDAGSVERENWRVHQEILFQL